MTNKIQSLPPVSAMMRASGLEPKKQFGQNFLFDLNLTGRIARSVPDIENSEGHENNKGINHFGNSAVPLWRKPEPVCGCTGCRCCRECFQQGAVQMEMDFAAGSHFHIRRDIH